MLQEFERLLSGLQLKQTVRVCLCTTYTQEIIKMCCGWQEVGIMLCAAARAQHTSRDIKICCGWAGGGYQSTYGLQNGAVHLGSGQPTAQQGFAGLSNLQLQQRLALLQESSSVGLPGQGLQVHPPISLIVLWSAALFRVCSTSQLKPEFMPGSLTFYLLCAFAAAALLPAPSCLW